MKAASIVLTFLLTFVLPAFTQVPTPPGGVPPISPEPNTIQLSDKERADVLQLQRDVEDAEVQSFQYKQKLDESNALVQSDANKLNAKITELKKSYKLADDDFFNQQKLFFVKAPSKPAEKK